MLENMHSLDIIIYRTTRWFSWDDRHLLCNLNLHYFKRDSYITYLNVTPSALRIRRPATGEEDRILGCGDPPGDS